MKFSFVLLAVLAAVTAVPLNNDIQHDLLLNDAVLRNNVIEQGILDALEDLRNTMLNGSEDVPVLDPFYLDHLELDDETIPVPGARVSVESTTVNNLSTFAIDELRVNVLSVILRRYNLFIDGHIPVLDVDTRKYDLSVSVMGIDIFGVGEAIIKIIKPRIVANLTGNLRLSIFGSYLTITESEVSFHLDGFEPQITGLFGDEPASAFVSSFLRNFVPEAVELFKPEITEFLSEIVMEVGNEILRDLNIGSLLPALQLN